MDWNFPYPTQPHCKLVINALLNVSYASWATGEMILLKQLSAWKSGRVESPLNNSHSLVSFFRYELPVTNSTSVLTIGFLVHSSKWKNKKYTFSISYFPAILLELLQPRGRGCKVRAIFIMIILCWIWKKMLNWYFEDGLNSLCSMLKTKVES